ncbi:putative type 1 membrane protein [Wolffia australiana]
MDPRVRAFHLVIVVSGLCLLHARGGSGNSVLFLDGSENKFIRSSSEIGDEVDSISLLEVAASVSVLLGIAPSASFTAKSPTKLNKFLQPNPFIKPRAVVMLEVLGVGDLLSDLNSILPREKTLISKIGDSGSAPVELLGDDEVHQIPIDESFEFDSVSADREFTNLAKWLGGSYVGGMESQNGVLEFPLPSGTSLKLHLSKKSDEAFASGIVSLVRGFTAAREMRDDLEASKQSPVAFLAGTFKGIKALRESGSVEIAQQGLELFHVVLTRLFGSLQTTYHGEVVGILLMSSETEAVAVGPMLPVKQLQMPPRYSRLMAEVRSGNASVPEVMLVRTTLAWVTGILLLLSVLIGIYFLLYMPFTRDTLLYSNVKMD